MPAYKLSFGARGENITILDVCNAEVIVMGPLSMFKGKNHMESWFGDKALPNTYYGKSDNGWLMTP